MCWHDFVFVGDVTEIFGAEAPPVSLLDVKVMEVCSVVGGVRSACGEVCVSVAQADDVRIACSVGFPQAAVLFHIREGDDAGPHAVAQAADIQRACHGSRFLASEAEMVFDHADFRIGREGRGVEGG